MIYNDNGLSIYIKHKELDPSLHVHLVSYDFTNRTVHNFFKMEVLTKDVSGIKTTKILASTLM